jgi:hypothetical protein
MILLILTSQVARITGMSYQHLAKMTLKSFLGWRSLGKKTGR